MTVLLGSIEKSRNNIRKSKKPTKKRTPKILIASCILYPLNGMIVIASSHCNYIRGQGGLCVRFGALLFLPHLQQNLEILLKFLWRLVFFLFQFFEYFKFESGRTKLRPILLQFKVNTGTGLLRKIEAILCALQVCRRSKKKTTVLRVDDLVNAADYLAFFVGKGKVLSALTFQVNTPFLSEWKKAYGAVHSSFRHRC